MNAIHTAFLLGTAAMLAACAATPEQQARRAAMQKQYEQNLQVALAEQCDRETASLMRRQFDTADQNAEPATAGQKAFRLKYIDKISDPMFQACYKMAWQNHISQQRLQEIRTYYYNRDWDDFYYPFHRRPLYWR